MNLNTNTNFWGKPIGNHIHFAGYYCLLLILSSLYLLQNQTTDATKATFGSLGREDFGERGGGKKKRKE
jgi:hypothetical protein